MSYGNSVLYFWVENVLKKSGLFLRYNFRVARKKLATGKQMTAKQAKYLEGVGQGMSKRQAALQAGYSPNTAKTPTVGIDAGITHKTGKTINELLHDILPPSKIFGVVKDGFEAKREHLTKDGDIIEGGKDHQNRLKAAQIAGNLHGMFKTKVEHSIDVDQFGDVIERKFGLSGIEDANIDMGEGEADFEGATIDV